jgi:Pyruvate/2-oxoacid:ferredoxin oxidoreductase gamma subunit
VLGIHNAHLADPLERLRDEGVLLLNSSVVDRDTIECAKGVTRLELDCSTAAHEVGNPMAGALVSVGALAAATGLVALPSLAVGVDRALPSYRRQHVDTSVAAIDAGAALVA